MSIFISKIVEARASQGISETQLAAKCGLTQKTLNNLLSGRTKRLDMDVVNRLNEALGIVSEPLTGYEVTSVQQSLPLDEKIKRLGLNAKDTRGLLELLKLDEDQKDEYIKQMMIHNLEKGRY